MSLQGQILAPKSGRWINEDVLYFSAASAKNSASELGDEGSNMTGLLWLVGQPVAQLETEKEGNLLSQSHTTAVIAAAPPLRCGQRRTVVEALVLSLRLRKLLEQMFLCSLSVLRTISTDSK